MRAPRIERSALLSIEAVTLIDANHSAREPDVWPKHGLDGLQIDA